MLFLQIRELAVNQAAGVLGSGGAGEGVVGVASGEAAGCAGCSGTPLSPAHWLSLSMRITHRGLSPVRPRTIRNGWSRIGTPSGSGSGKATAECARRAVLVATASAVR